MNDKEVLNVGIYRIELTVPDRSRDLKHTLSNNINVYVENGQFLWNISKLLKTYSDKNGLKYYEELYFDIRLIDNDKIFCIGFTNHCEVDLKAESITKLVNNK